MADALTSDLVARAAAGDAGAIEALLSVAQTDIRRYARRSCRNTSDAEEAVQETLIVLYRKVGTLREVGAISAWLFRIVNRYCLRLAMRLMGVPAAIEAEAVEQRFAQVPKPELRIDIARAIQSLPEHYCDPARAQRRHGERARVGHTRHRGADRAARLVCWMVGLIETLRGRMY